MPSYVAKQSTRFTLYQRIFFIIVKTLSYAMLCFLIAYQYPSHSLTSTATAVVKVTQSNAGAM